MEADSMLKALKNSKPGLQRIDLLLSIAQFHIFKPGENQIDFDSAEVYIEKARELNALLKSSDASGYILTTESYLYREKGQREQSKKMVEEAIKLLETGTNKSYLGSAYYELSGYYAYWNVEELAPKILLVKKSLAAFQQAGNLKKIAQTLEMLGDLYVRQEKFHEGVETLKQALATYQAMKNPKVQGVYVLIGEAYLKLNDYGQALINLQIALKTAHKLNDTSMRLCQINYIMCSLYWQINRMEESLKYGYDALKTAIKYHDESSIFTTALATSVNLNTLNRPAAAVALLDSIPKTYLATLDTTRLAVLRMAYLRSYVNARELNKAQSFANSCLLVVNNMNLDYQIKLGIYRLVASCYLYKKQYSLARYYLMKNVEIQKEVHFEFALIEDAKIWYKLDSAEGNFKSAFNYFSFVKRKADSLLNESRIRQLQVLNVEYKTAMKDDSINLKDKDIALLTKENSLQQASLKQATLISYITVVGIALAFLITGLLYRQYRQKQKTNRKLQSQQREITQQNISLQHLLTEKEWLVKEIHHRVKNNLQTVMSLLNSQTAFVDNPFALSAIHDSQHRVHAMSLIHQKLYGSDNVSTIDMSIYIREMVSYLTECFDAGQRVRFEYNVPPLELDVSQAVPLGLILNEAITNALKYAFPDGGRGTIVISLSYVDASRYVLTIADNGIGIRAQSSTERPGSLGMSLMKGLSEDLDGSFSIENNNGTIITITFTYDRIMKRQNTLAIPSISNN
jgi:two-component sensor histidine kinase